MNDRPILVVDDDPDIRESIKDVLEMEGYQAVTAENGKVAWDLLHAEATPCLVLLDLMMPVMSGGELLAALRNDRDPALAKTKVIVVSAWRDEAMQIDQRAEGFMEKPFTLDTLLQTVERFCGERKR